MQHSAQGARAGMRCTRIRAAAKEGQAAAAVAVQGTTWRQGSLQWCVLGGPGGCICALASLCMCACVVCVGW